MANPTLQQQLTAWTQQQIFQLLLNYYQTAGYPTTAWEQGEPDLAHNQAFATALQDVSTNYIPAIAGGTLLDYAPNYPGWTGLTALQIYNLPQNLATFTQGYITATNTSTAAYSYSPSNPLIAVFGASGNRYISQGSGTIPASGSLSILFQAEFAGASYADPSNSGNLTLVTPLPGVTLTNPSQNYSAVSHTGTGTGTLTLSGTPTGAHTVIFYVTATSSGNPVTVSYSLDGGPQVPLGAVTGFSNLGGFGISGTFVNGASGTSWVNGDQYQFSTPAPWIASQGANLEADTALAGRCRNKWSTQSAIPTQSFYQFLATSTPSVGAQVTQCIPIPDSTVNNRVNIIVAGPGGVLPPATVALIQAYVTPRARGCDNPVVMSPTTQAITIAATILASAATMAAVQSAVQTVLLNYIAGVGINGTIRISTIVELIMQVAGVVDVSGVTINGVAANLVLGSSTTYVLAAYPPTLNLTYNGQ